MHQILIRPLITEKMSDLTAEHQQYGFIVSSGSNKIEIAKAIESKFNVHVETVRTINRLGKIKTQFRKSGRFSGKSSGFKKALVTLREGEKIDLFEEV